MKVSLKGYETVSVGTVKDGNRYTVRGSDIELLRKGCSSIRLDQVLEIILSRSPIGTPCGIYVYYQKEWVTLECYDRITLEEDS